MDKDIEDIIRRCHSCALVAPKPQADFQPWPEPDLPWQRVHINFAGPFWEEKWLLIKDAKTKFAFAEAMGTEMTAKKTIQVLERLFGFCGPCTANVSDNGPPFNSQEMTVFYNKYSIEHINSPAYHPQSNGLCERFVRSFKEDMQKLKNGGVTNKLKALLSFLRSYRWTPHSTTGIAPAESFFNQKIRTELACLHPAAVPPSTPVTITNGKFKFAQPVWVNTASLGERANWSAAFIEKQLGGIIYLVRLSNGRSWKAHANQLHSRFGKSTAFEDLDLEEELSQNTLPDAQVQKQIVPEDATPAQVEPEAAPDAVGALPEGLRYPERQRRPQQQYIPSLTNRKGGVGPRPNL
uniref:Integrase catalytic domain-containing protein n=1 Tax=Plectus sambesii TaxID=2011161 RepID=A0A914W144_9BILA